MYRPRLSTTNQLMHLFTYNRILENRKTRMGTKLNSYFISESTTVSRVIPYSWKTVKKSLSETRTQFFKGGTFEVYVLITQRFLREGVTVIAFSKRLSVYSQRNFGRRLCNPFNTRRILLFGVCMFSYER